MSRQVKMAWIVAAGLTLLALTLFLIGIQFPAKLNFDEYHYVPAAKQVLQMKETKNWEHPPLGKMIMSVGIGAFGDRPIGWRFMSALFGCITLLAFFWWSLRLFKSLSLAVFVSLLTLVNHLLFVQARIGMLDTFMFGFMAWALALFSYAWDPELPAKKVWRAHLGAGALFGLATACKWAAVVPWFFCLGLVLFVKLLSYWGVEFERKTSWARKRPDFKEWYVRGLWSKFGLGRVAVAYLAVPVALYFLTFVPYLWVDRQPAYGVVDLFAMQFSMWAGQLRVTNTHPYMSQWYEWALLLRPIWYAFVKSGEDGHVRGVLLLGNPLVMWAGLIAWGVCVWAWLAQRSRQAFLIAVFYSVLYFSWVFIPRKILFYYYYYPAGMMLSLALAFVFHSFERGPRFKNGAWARWTFLGLSVAVFIYFYPILSGMKIPTESFREWMWFSRWI